MHLPCDGIVRIRFHGYYLSFYLRISTPEHLYGKGSDAFSFRQAESFFYAVPGTVSQKKDLHPTGMKVLTRGGSYRIRTYDPLLVRQVL